MMKTNRLLLLLLALLSISAGANAQLAIRPLETLIDKKEPGWVPVQEWIAKAKNKVEVLPVHKEQAAKALYEIQVTTKAPMGAIVYNSGGILIDRGWIRILGSGDTKLNRTLPGWNKNKTFAKQGEVPGYLLIADDVLGGFFMLNGGSLGEDKGKVYYWAPDNLDYEPLDMTYTQFLLFCLNGDLDKFYEGYRWAGWEQEVAAMNGDQVFSFFPYLWMKEGEDINKCTRSIVPVEEQYSFNTAFRKKLGKE